VKKKSDNLDKDLVGPGKARHTKEIQVLEPRRMVRLEVNAARLAQRSLNTTRGLG
jgi:hypothetical protein